MKRIFLTVAIAGVFGACGNGSENSTNSDDSASNINSTTPPPAQDTNPIGIMMGDTTIGIYDSLKKDSLKSR